jgi:hypothetical protein
MQPFTSQWVVNRTGKVFDSIGVGMPLNVCFEKSTNTL